ncbi:MAG: thioredoxin domain-containing protein [Elainellaceae cyanobacterium]
MTNRLAQSQSLYLRKHAENPIDWWSWCDEALEKAARENKPIFLSIGYSSCHWCTVMEGEAFSDRAIANYMNDNFVPIKVDREERPDLDSIYMQALQLMVGQGGWPLNVFLSPDDLVPFYGGTYFPLEPRYGRPGFLQVLQAIRGFYDTEHEKVQSVTDEIRGRLQRASALPHEQFESDVLRTGLENSAGILTAGGPGPRFPMIPYADAALQGARFKFENARYDAADLAKQRGLDLALGGICDHVGGGFHRYTVDPTWTVPHFEKMLYDNGQIVEYLANLWAFGVKDPAFERAIAKTVEWLKREMTAPQGFFYAAQDADSFETPSDVEPEEGAFYVWSYAELSELLTDDELRELAEAFTITSEGNFEGKNVLQRRHPGELSHSTELILSKLFRARYGNHPDTAFTMPPARNNHDAKSKSWSGRIPSVTDTKMIVAWNSLMISGLARASIVFENLDYYTMAAEAARFILDYQWIDGRFHRLNYDGESAVLAQSEDYALFIKALLDLHQAALVSQRSPHARSDASTWLDQAVKLHDEFDQWLWSIELGGYYNTASDASGDLVVRERSYEDNATPSANGVAIANLVRLALSTENLDYLSCAEQALQSFSTVMNRAPRACPTLFTALDWYQNYTLVRTSGEHLAALLAQYFPTTVYLIESDLPDGAVGLVCQGLSCQEPAQTWDHLQTQLHDSQIRGH